MRTIVWDIDDVLCPLMRDWFALAWKPEHPECTLTYDDIRENPPHRVLGIERADYLASLDAFRSSDIAGRMQPNAELLDWFQRKGDSSRHVALTARPLESAPEAAEWLFRHFGRWIRCFGFVPSRPDASTPLYDRNKGDFLQWLGSADLLIDDSPENIAQAQALGIETHLYPQPWNDGAARQARLMDILSHETIGLRN